MKYGQRAEIIDAEPNGMIDYTEPKDDDIIETDEDVTVVLEGIPIQKKDDEEDIPFQFSRHKKKRQSRSPTFLIRHVFFD